MPPQIQDQLAQCSSPANCVLVEWKFKDVDMAFKKLVEISSKQPRVEILEKSNSYFHAVCRTLIFRFPDDLEILKNSKLKSIQVKSSSRIGLSDLGVNHKRVEKLRKALSGNI